ncbi:myosin heavy chain kinase B-like [Uloborus diversus]|uniref:myosin heavy chain kinase B-like n=1 Tax=Uloborus diversus TaxID=327109 RepID=UPI002409929B|nr:myosin heavy chain kinase B-like [Uloborus diversus]
MNMKRQVCANRSSSDEPEANQVNESKRIKLAHIKQDETAAENIKLEEGTDECVFEDHIDESAENNQQHNYEGDTDVGDRDSPPPPDTWQYGYDGNDFRSSQDIPMNNAVDYSDCKPQEDSMQDALPILENYSLIVHQENGNFDESHENGVHMAEGENGHEQDSVSEKRLTRSARKNAANEKSSFSPTTSLQPPNIMHSDSLPELVKIQEGNDSGNHVDHEIANGNGSSPDISGQNNSCQLEDTEKESDVCNSSPSKNAKRNLDSDFNLNGKQNFDVENLTLSYLEATVLEGHADVVYSVAADEDIVLSSSGDTTVKVWSVEEKKEICSFAGHTNAVTSIILLTKKQSENLCSKLNLPNSRIAVSASLDCHVKLWSVDLGQEVLSLYTFNGITSIGYLESEHCVVVGTEGGKLEVWNLESSKAIHSVRAHEDSISDLKVEENYVYSASVDGTVKVWLFEEDDLQPLYTRRRKELCSNKIDFAPTQWKAVTAFNNILYLGDNSNNLKVLDWSIGHLRTYKNLIDGSGLCESVLAKNNILLSSFYDSTSDIGGINVWRIPELSYVCTLTGNVQEICSLALTATEKSLRIVSGGHQLLVWDFDFSRPPKKNAKEEGFYVCEIEKIGSEINEKPSSMDKLASPSKSTTVGEIPASKTSWCNVM